MTLFFFSSRRRHTRSLCDWSSDVCSSDLVLVQGATRVGGAGRPPGRHRGLPEAPERLRARETMEPLRVGPVAAPAVPEARALRPVPLVRQADARVLRVHTRGERQARDRGSAKSPVRTFALSMVPGIDLYAVHLVRNGRGVITSLRKTLKKDVQAGIMWDHEGRPMWKTAVRWTVLNLASEWVCARLGPGRAMRLRYEDFVADAASSGEPLRVGHNIGGNRTKKSGYLTLRPDAREWEGTREPAEQRLT